MLLLFQVSLVEATMLNTPKYWVLADLSNLVHGINMKMDMQLLLDFLYSGSKKPAFSCLNSTMETSEQGVNHVRSQQ